MLRLALSTLAIGVTLLPIPNPWKLYISLPTLLAGSVNVGLLIKQNYKRGTALEELEQSLKAQYETLANELIVESEDLKKREEELNESIQQHEDEHAKFIEQFSELQAKQLEWIDTETSALEERFSKQWDEYVKEAEEAQKLQIEEMVMSYETTIYELKQQLQNVQSRLYELEYMPKLCPTTYGKTADIINTLIKQIAEISAQKFDPTRPYDLLTVDYVRHVVPQNDDELVAFLRPKNPAATKKIVALADELQVGIGYDNVEIQPDNGCLKFRLVNEIFKDNSQITESLEDLESQLIEPSLVTIKKIFHGLIHAFVWGETGSGKSTFIINLIDLIDYENTRDGGTQEIKFSDPKFPHNNLDGDNYLVLDGVMPCWTNWNSVYNICVEMLHEVNFRIGTHKKEAKDKMISGDLSEPLSTFNPVLYILDELETQVRKCNNTSLGEAQEYLHQHNIQRLMELPGKEQEFTLSDSINEVMKLARSSKIKFIGIGQSPMPSDYDLKRIDFLNTTRVWLGEVAKTVVSGRGSEFVQMSAAQKKQFRQQIELREKINLIRSSRGLDPIRYGLIHAPNMPVVLMTMPAPHQLTRLVYDTDHAYKPSGFAVPQDLHNAPTTADPTPIDVTPDPGLMSSQDAVRANLNRLLHKQPLSDIQQYVMDFFSTNPNEAFSLAVLKDRRSKLKKLSSENLATELHGLLKLGLIQEVKDGTKIKLQFKDQNR
jgi:ABC-type dipeptide/oligopeptide/nickel transport system ATPase component